MNQPQVVTYIPIRKGLVRVGLRGKISGAHSFLKPKVLFKHLRFQGQHCIIFSKAINFKFTKSDSVHICGKKIKPLNHRPRVQPNPRSDVKCREVTKQKKNYSSPHTSPIYHFPKKLKYPERHFLDQPQNVTALPEVEYSKNTEVDFLLRSIRLRYWNLCTLSWRSYRTRW